MGPTVEDWLKRHFPPPYCLDYSLIQRKRRDLHAELTRMNPLMRMSLTA